MLNKDNGKILRKAFIPVMIYDDLLESFLYNKMVLEKKLGISEEEYGETDEQFEEEISEIKLVNFKDLEENNLLISLTPEDYNNKNFDLDNLINNIEFSDIFLDLVEEEEDFFNI